MFTIWFHHYSLQWMARKNCKNLKTLNECNFILRHTPFQLICLFITKEMVIIFRPSRIKSSFVLLQGSQKTLLLERLRASLRSIFLLTLYICILTSNLPKFRTSEIWSRKLLLFPSAFLSCLKLLLPLKRTKMNVRIVSVSTN